MRSRTSIPAALCLALVMPASALGDVGSGLAAAGGGQALQGESSRVYMRETQMGQVCITTDAGAQHGFPLTLTLNHGSHLSVLFTGEFGGLDENEEGMLLFSLDGGSMMSPQWSFSAPPQITRDAATISWTFPNVPKGTHTVEVDAQVTGGNQSGQIDRCSLTVTVIDPNLGVPIASSGTASVTKHVDGNIIASNASQTWIARFEVRTTPSGDVQFGYIELYGIGGIVAGIGGTVAGGVKVAGVGGDIHEFTVNHVSYFKTASGAQGATLTMTECRIIWTLPSPPTDVCTPVMYQVADGSAVGQPDTFLDNLGWTVESGNVSIYSTTNQNPW